MTKFERRLFSYSNLLVSFVGIIYFIYKYFFKVQTDFGIRPNPATSFWLHFHIVTVPVIVFLVGYLYKLHIYPKLKRNNSKRKKSGIILIFLFILMTLSGYLLQLAFDINDSIGIIHIIASFLWFFGYLWHFRFRF